MLTQQLRTETCEFQASQFWAGGCPIPRNGPSSLALCAEWVTQSARDWTAAKNQFTPSFGGREVDFWKDVFRAEIWARSCVANKTRWVKRKIDFWDIAACFVGWTERSRTDSVQDEKIRCMLNSISISIPSLCENVCLSSTATLKHHGQIWSTEDTNLIWMRGKKEQGDLKQVHNYTQGLKVTATHQIIKIRRLFYLELAQSSIHTFMNLIPI